MRKRSRGGWVCLVLIVIWLVGRSAKIVTIQFQLADDSSALGIVARAAVLHHGSTYNNTIDRSGSPLASSKSNNHWEYIAEDEKNGMIQSTLQPQDDNAGAHGNSPLGNVTILKRMRNKWIIGYNEKRIVNETIMGKQYLVRIETSNGQTIQSRQAVYKKLRRKFKAKLDFANMTHIDRIYYINMDHRPLKRAMMESWLSQQGIPYSRVTGKTGQSDSCVPQKTGPRCLGISGLAQTNVFIMEQLETKGITLVLEDDFVIRDMNKLLASVQLVPPDWDVLRWDCWDSPFPHFPSYPYSFQLAPIDDNMCRNVRQCWFCGGTHVVMWKGGESIEKLRKLWGTPPHDGIDCQLMDPSIKSYCIQIGVGEFHYPQVEPSDIPK